MIPKEELFLTGDRERIWQKYCGFLELSLAEFMEIQEKLLIDQIDTVYDSSLGRKFLPEKPKNVSEFRQLPLTTYDDYAAYLNEKNEEVLATEPYCWAHTSGRGGSPKWVPYTEEAMVRLGISSIALAILSCTNKKYEVNIGGGLRILHNLPAPPYLSGILVDVVPKMMDAHIIPPPEKYVNIDFEIKLRDGFQMALRTGVDFSTSLTSVLIKMGERFTESAGQIKLDRHMLHPQVMMRLIGGWLRSKREGRVLLPKDLWRLKGLCCFGMDTSIYKEQLKYYWGTEPLECYATTETGLIATEAWNKKFMTFLPFACFLEFVPESEWLMSQKNKEYQPSTILIDEVKPDNRYEIIVTSFYGMPFLRYRLGDLVKIVALEDKEAGINLPQMIFDSRADGLIDIASFIRLDEKTIWQAIANTGIKYEDWTVRKEYDQDRPLVCLYIELKEKIEAEELEIKVQQELSRIYSDYRDLESMLGIQPLCVRLLPAGSFQRYYKKKQESGADLAHLKPPHMNADDNIMQDLFKLG